MAGAVLVQDGELVAEVQRRGAGEGHGPGEGVVFQAELAGEGRGSGAALEIAVIAVDMALLAARAHRREPSICQFSSSRRLAVQRQAADACSAWSAGRCRPTWRLRWIRLERRGADHAQAGGRARRHQMNLAVAEAPAGIGIKPRQIGLGMKAPAGIGDAFGRAIETESAIVHAPLRAAPCHGHRSRPAARLPCPAR